MKQQTQTPDTTKPSYVEPVILENFDLVHYFNGKHDQYCIERPEGWTEMNAIWFGRDLKLAYLNHQKLKAQKEELAKALQDMIEWHENHSIVANSAKGIYANAKQVLKEAGLTNE